MTTHAHRKGEFPSKEKPKKAIEKDVAYHVHHAEKHAGLAREAHAAHTAATSVSARAEAALRAAHANKKAQKHAAEAEKQSPGSHEALTARSHANEAKSRYELTQTKSPQEMQKRKVAAEKLYHDQQSSAAAQTVGTPTSKAKEKALAKTLATERYKTLAAKAKSLSSLADKSKSGHVEAAQAHTHASEAASEAGDDNKAFSHKQDAKYHTHMASENHGSGSFMGSTLGFGQGGQKPDVSKPMPSSVKAASKSEHHSDEHLAEVVHATIPHVPDSGRFGDRKVFSHEVYEAMPAADKAKFGSLNDFKSKLRTLNQKALIQLARADLVGAMNPVQVQKSHVSFNDDDHFYKDHSPHANFIVDQTKELGMTFKPKHFAPKLPPTPNSETAATAAKNDALWATKDAKSIETNPYSSDADKRLAHEKAAEAHEKAAQIALSPSDQELHKSKAKGHRKMALTY